MDSTSSPQVNSASVRQKYLDFFKKRGHAVILSASLLPENDPSTLFTSSGMQPLVPYLLGEKHPAGKRLCDSQKSFRAGDIDEVGDGRHSTFFEMLGNWSLGDYFKKEQLPWFWEFLTKELNIDPKRLYVSVYQGNPEIGVAKDEESVAIWTEIFKKEGLDPKNRIFYYGDDKNWWSRSGAPANMPIGEIGGPDSEVFYDTGIPHNPAFGNACHINCDCGKYLEIGNSVFIEFLRTEKGFEPLPQKNVDFGGGLERLAMVVGGHKNIFETDLYEKLIKKISALSGKQYQDYPRAFEIIADHIKAAVFIMGDDRVTAPSNTDQGYMVRRLLRRAIIYGKKLGITDTLWTTQMAVAVSDTYADVYNELKRNLDFIKTEITKEEEKFNLTLEKGLEKYKKAKSRIQNDGSKLKIMPGNIVFDLYQTYGFPPELTKELAAEDGLQIHTEEFDELFKKHQELSRTASAGKFKGGLADKSEEVTKLHTATHLLLEALRQVLGEHVHQKGSNITAERLRLDFSHLQKMTSEQIIETEKIVNKAIADNLPVSFEEMSLEEAKKAGVEGVFESKYGEKVKVYTVKDFSREICGGPHVENTGILGKFHIAKEEASSAGVRRIKAILS